VTPPDQAGADAAPKTSSIPAQRAAQSLRLLVLGKGEDATAVRERATAAGVELAQRFSTRVTHVVVDSSVGDDDARLTRARTAGLPIIGADAAGDLLDGVVPAPRDETPDMARAAGTTGTAETAGLVAEELAGGAADTERRSGFDVDVDVDVDVDPAAAGTELAQETARIEAVQRTATSEVDSADVAGEIDFADAMDVTDAEVIGATHAADVAGSAGIAGSAGTVGTASIAETAQAEDEGTTSQSESFAGSRGAAFDSGSEGAEQETGRESDEIEVASTFTGSPLEAELFFPPLADDEPDLLASLSTAVEAEADDLEASLPYEEPRWGRRRGRRGRDRAPAMPVDSLAANTPTSMTTTSPAIGIDADTDTHTDMGDSGMGGATSAEASASADADVERFALSETATSGIGIDSADDRDNASLASIGSTATTEGESTDSSDAAAATEATTSDQTHGARSAAVTAGSFAWALVPLVSVGLLTPVSIGYAAVRTRSRSLGFTAAWYTAAVAASIALSAAGRHHAAHPSAGDLSAACLAASWVGGTVQSFLIRRRVFR
jgi:hypothetical protein